MSTSWNLAMGYTIQWYTILFKAIKLQMFVRNELTLHINIFVAYCCLLINKWVIGRLVVKIILKFNGSNLKYLHLIYIVVACIHTYILILSIINVCYFCIVPNWKLAYMLVLLLSFMQTTLVEDCCCGRQIRTETLPVVDNIWIAKM